MINSRGAMDKLCSLTRCIQPNSKNGAMDKETLVKTIIIIVSFAIIAIFIYFYVSSSGGNKSDICKSSLTFASKGGDSFLQCEPTMVCLSAGKGCTGKYDKTVKLSIIDSKKDKDVLFKAIADEMADCWWMFGEGKVDYLSFKSILNKEAVCGICSYISFDTELRQKFSNDPVKYSDFYEYLTRAEVKSQVSYFNYFYGVPFSDKVDYTPLGAKDFSPYQNSLVIDFSRNYVVITGENKKANGNHEFVRPFFFSVSDFRNKVQCSNFDLTSN